MKRRYDKAKITQQKVNKDIILKEFWRDNRRFADVFNTVVFKGEEMIDAQKLEEMDTDVSGSIEMKDYRESLKRMRDVVKKEIRGVEFVIMGIEDQMHIHYAIPLRNMIYDALGYLKEYREISARNRKEGITLKNPEEFLSGLRREDRLHPIVTLVIYYGDKPWDGPMSLKDMLSDMPKALEKAVSDYKIHLLQVNDSGKYEFSSEDVRAAFEISREAMNDRLDEIAKKYHDGDWK